MKSRNSKWVRNEQCPNCQAQGRDKHSDNLAVYDDGHKWCWSCGSYFAATEKRKASDIMTNEEIQRVHCPVFNESKVEGSHRNWLRTYLSDDEIDEFFFVDKAMDRHVFLYHKDEPDWWYSARSVSAHRIPKSLHEGTRPALCLGKYKESRVLVIVEDIVSAIKVARHFGAMPLFGSFLPVEWITKVQRTGHIDYVVLWLDEDKAIESRLYARKCNLLLPTISITTEQDPKAHNDEEIKELVNEAVELINDTETYKPCN